MMNRSLVAIFIASLFLVPGMGELNLAEAQNFAPTAERGVALLAELTLRGDQRTKSKALMAAARKKAIHLRAEIEISAIDLATELEKENPSESSVGRLVDKMSKLEGEWRRSRILTWIKIRKLLNTKQRRALKRLQNANGRNIVKAQGEFINPFQDRAVDGDRRSLDLNDPFARKSLGRVQFSTESPARIIIDGKPRGLSPLDLRLRAGKHRIRAVFLDGRKPMKRTITVVADKLSYVHIQRGSQAPGAKSP